MENATSSIGVQSWVESLGAEYLGLTSGKAGRRLSSRFPLRKLPKGWMRRWRSKPAAWVTFWRG